MSDKTLQDLLSRPDNVVTEQSTTCPYCGRENQSHVGVDDESARPEVGDLSVCHQCRHVSIFCAGGVRKLNVAELIRVSEDDEASAALASVGAIL